MDDIKSVFCRNVKRYRESKGLSQKELGERSGFATSYIAQIETNRVGPSGSSLVQISKALGITPNDLLFDNLQSLILFENLNMLPPDILEALSKPLDRMTLAQIRVVLGLRDEEYEKLIGLGQKKKQSDAG